MKASVITILDNERSRQVADRCMRSAEKYGLKVAYFKAITPKDSPIKIASQEGIPIDNFEDETYSRFDVTLSAFLSHYWLWKMTAAGTEPHVIFEHDAVMVSPLMGMSGDIVNLGSPSYGKFKTPTTLGIGPLMSKPYFPGAHAYYITPKGAQQLVDKAKTHAEPTDIFINKTNFPDVKEYYPWPAMANDSFTTIQKRRGCLAKHNYGETFDII